MKTLVFLLGCLTSVFSFAASFDCSKASTGIEHAICGNILLSRLDLTMADTYSRLRRSLAPSKAEALVTEQKQWLKTRNTQCRSAGNKISCLLPIYRQRVDELLRRAETPALPSAEVSEAICEKIEDHNTLAAMIETGLLYQAYQAPALKHVDINNDGDKEFAEACTPNTAAEPCVSWLNDEGKRLEIKPVGFSWSDYAIRSRVALLHEDHWYVLHLEDAQAQRPQVLTTITPKNYELQVCEFSNQSRTEYRSTDGTQSKLCQAANAGETSKAVIPFSNTTVTQSEKSQIEKRGETQIRGKALIDFDNDGEPSPVVALSYTSGAGSGCEYNYFDVLESSKHSQEHPQRQAFLAMQQVALDARHPNCGTSIANSRENRLLSFNGSIYYHNMTEKHAGIYRLENGRTETICLAEQVTKTSRKLGS